MRLIIRHETAYTYASPARFAMQVLRLTPSSFDSQFVRRWRVEVNTDARLERGEDAFGNITHTVFIDGPVSDLQILIEGEVETQDRSGLVQGTVERLPLRFYLRPSALTQPTPALADFARGIAAAEGGDMLATLHGLMAGIPRSMMFDTGATDSRTTADQAFTAGRGVCQDFAHVFVACARALAIPARYVGGHYMLIDRIEQGAGHAWAEAYLGDLGWIGFDPANGVCVTERYVRVAIGLDYLDAAPVRGAQTGGGGETLSVTVHVEQGQAVQQ